ncbi:MAG: hypothetical protein IGS54_02020 [Elainella sp. C42_A2020_010]|nr:hypothetical protein [Elainella sp. C42_A2020_010]RNJ69893.1 MAG: hypothetical protein EDM05_07145 [Leptolyngbya sp. IPPAS B-1204]
MSLRLSSLSLKRLGLSLGALLLGGSPLISFANAAQARPNWLNLERASSDRMSTVAQSSTPTRRSPTSTTTQNLNDVRFSCQVVNGQYTVMYNPQSQPGQYYPWATPTAMGGGWSPDRRCNEISRRLEFYRPDGLLELQTGLENGYNTVCVTTEAMPSCRIVLTVPQGQDPVALRDRIFNNLLVADSGQQTTAATAYQGGDNGILNQLGQAIGVDLSNLAGGRRSSSPASIDLRPFLDPADGGTGARLTNSAVPAQTGPRLNPGNFR